jgi:TonB family protein
MRLGIGAVLAVLLVASFSGRAIAQVQPPQKIKDVRPVYPEAAIRARVEGVVVVEATITATGNVSDAVVTQSIPALDQAALDAVRQWQYKPAVMNGVATPVIVTVTVAFDIDAAMRDLGFAFDAPTATVEGTAVARHLVAQGTVVQVGVEGTLKFGIDKEAPAFAMPGGESPVLLLRLPDYEVPYTLTISSTRMGIGRTTEVFIPSGIVFDSDLKPLGQFGEERLKQEGDSLVAKLQIFHAAPRYLLVYTRGDEVGQRVGRLFFGLFVVNRSLEGNIQVEAKRGIGAN